MAITNDMLLFDPYAFAQAGLQWENSPSLRTGNYLENFTYQVLNTQPSGEYGDVGALPSPLQIEQNVFAPDVIEPSSPPTQGEPTVDYTTVGDSGGLDLGSLFTSTASNVPSSTGSLQNLITAGLGAALGLAQTSVSPYNVLVPNPKSITLNAYACPRGKHVSKATKGPSAGKCVTNRHMNPLNPKALGRAVRRLSGFQHFAVKTEKAIQASFRKAGVFPHRRSLSGGRCGTCRKTKCSC